MRSLPKWSPGGLATRVAVLSAGLIGACRNPVSPISGTLSVGLTSTRAAQGDTISLSIVLPDGPLAGDLLLITFSGYGQSVDSLTIPAGVGAYGGSLVIPPEVGDGVLVIQASIPAIHQSAADSLVIKDNVPPQIDSMQLVPPRPLPPYAMGLSVKPPYAPGVTFIAGIADTLHAIVSDNHALGWLLLSWGSPINQRDSVRLNGLVDTLTLPIQLPTSAAGTAPELTVTLRDADGNIDPMSYGQAQVAQYADYPARTTRLTTPVADLAFDTKRNLIYLAEPTANQVAVFSPATMSFQTPIAIAGRPVGVNVRPGGDTLVATLDSTATIALINLTSTPHLTTTLTMPVLTDTVSAQDTAKFVSQVRVAADNRAIVSMYGPNWFPNMFSDAGVAVNLATDSITVLFAPWIDGAVPPPVLRSPDGTWVMLTNGTPGPYSAVTHSYTTWNPGSDGPPEMTSISNGPNYSFLMDHVFFSYVNAAVGEVGLDRFFGAALSPTGADAYVADAPCAAGDSACVDSASGIVLHYAEPVILNGPDTGLIGTHEVGQLTSISDAPFVARSLVVTPDGKSLVGISPTGLVIFDLTQTTPPPELARMARGANHGAAAETMRGVVRSSPSRAAPLRLRVTLTPRKTRQRTPS